MLWGLAIRGTRGSKKAARKARRKIERENRRETRKAKRFNKDARYKVEGLFYAVRVAAEDELRKKVPVRTGKMRSEVTKTGGDTSAVLSTVRYAPYVVRYEAALKDARFEAKRLMDGITITFYDLDEDREGRLTMEKKKVPLKRLIKLKISGVEVVVTLRRAQLTRLANAVK